MPVYMEINILAEYPHFVPTNTGAYLTFTQRRYSTEAVGYGGLLLYIGLDSQYHAFDMACPACLNPKKPIQPDGIYAVCPLCYEHYDISYGVGSPTKGIAREPLRHYSTSYNPQTGKLIVRQ